MEIAIRAVDLIMEAASTSETLVSLYQTARRDIPADSHLDSHLLGYSSLQAYSLWHRNRMAVSIHTDFLFISSYVTCSSAFCELPSYGQ